MDEPQNEGQNVQGRVHTFSQSILGFIFPLGTSLLLHTSMRDLRASKAAVILIGTTEVQPYIIIRRQGATSSEESEVLRNVCDKKIGGLIAMTDSLHTCIACSNCFEMVK